MGKVPSRVISALATLPISFLFIPYAYWRSKQDPWYSVFIRPLLAIFAAWSLAVLVPIGVVWMISIGLVLWQSYSLKSAVDAHRPRPEQVRREEWRR